MLDKKHILEKTNHWLTQGHFDKTSLALLTQACHFSESLADQHQQSEPFEQGLAIATELQALKCDSETLSVALIYPSFIQWRVPMDLITKTLGSAITKLLVGTKRMEIIDALSPRASAFSQQRNLIDNMRKMLLAMVDDIRVVLIKLAERLVYLRHLSSLPATLQKEIAKKAMDIYAPLANRLGIGQFKWQIEDEAFYYLNRDDYNTISKYLNMQHEERESYIQQVIVELQQLLPPVLAKKNKNQWASQTYLQYLSKNAPQTCRR